MTRAHVMKQGDTEPKLEVELTDRDGAPADLSGATCRLVITGPDGAVVVDKPVVATENVIEYAWVVGETGQLGIHKGEVEVTYSGGAIQTFPNGPEYFFVLISEDLD